MSLASHAKACVCLGILTPLSALAQTKTSIETAKATPSPVAYVYVQSSSGVEAYSAASNGKLTKISGSPFQTTGAIAGSTGSIFYTIGTDYIHSYAVASDGGIKAQVSEINSQKYSGAACGTVPDGAGGVLDHSGKYFYLQLSKPAGCDVFQTYTIGKDGALTFNNWTELAGDLGPIYVPTILGNEAFAYSIQYDVHYSSTVGFAREPSGALQVINTQETDPSDPNGANAYPTLVAADPTDHLAVTLAYNASNPPYLGSYTADGEGNITSTNPFDKLQLLPFAATELAMSPSGTFVAVAGGYPSGYGAGDGLEIYHFNGADPITSLSGLVTDMEIDAIKWDSSNHLYAISTKTNQLFVYTVTGNSISEAPGSPYTIKDPTGLVTKSL